MKFPNECRDMNRQTPEPTGAAEEAEHAEHAGHKDGSESWIRSLHPHLTRRLGALRTRSLDALSADEQGDTELWADALLADAYDAGASDVHVSVHEDFAIVRMRIDGNLLDVRTLSASQGERLIRHFKVMANLDPMPLFKPAESRRSYHVADQDLDLRIAFSPTVAGEKMAIRLLRPDNLYHSLEELGLDDSQLDRIETWMHAIGGMVLVGGPTGSGKTTTLYTMLHRFRQIQRSVVTIEDPVEYELDGIDQIQVDSARGLNYARGIRSLLRLDPDIILVGEIRDAESANAAVQASLTGHVVMSTLHARNAIGAVSALRHWDVPLHELAYAVQMVIAQRLVRRLCPHCRKRRAVTEQERNWLDTLPIEPPAEAFSAQGCDACQGIGYRGRTGVFEVWPVVQEDQKIMAEDCDESALRASLQRRRMPTLLEQGFRLIGQGVTSLEEMTRLCGLFVPIDADRDPVST